MNGPIVALLELPCFTAFMEDILIDPLEKAHLRYTTVVGENGTMTMVNRQAPYSGFQNSPEPSTALMIDCEPA
jgi:hypothetical protein